MTVPLLTQTQSMLQAAFGSTPNTLNSLLSAANRSPYFAGLLNAYASAGHRIVVGNTAQNQAAGTFTDGQTITIDSTWLIDNNPNAESGDVFATTLAHELSHDVLPGGLSPATASPDAAMLASRTAEGVALTGEFIVASQLGSRMHSDPLGALALSFNADATSAGVNLSQATVGDPYAAAFTSPSGLGVTDAGSGSASFHPSTAPQLTYDQWAMDSWIVEHCSTIPYGTVNWRAVAGVFSYSIDQSGTCTVNSTIPILSTTHGAADGYATIVGTVSASGALTNLTESVYNGGAQTYTQTTNTDTYGHVAINISGVGDVAHISNASVNVQSGSTATVVGANDSIVVGSNATLSVENDNQNRVGIPERPTSPTLDRVIGAGTGGQFTLSGAGEVDVSASGAGIMDFSGSADVFSGNNNSIFLNSNAAALNDGAIATVLGAGTIYASYGSIVMGVGHTDNISFKGNNETVTSYDQGDTALFSGQANIFNGYNDNLGLSSYGYGWGAAGSSLTVHGSDNIDIESSNVELTASNSNVYSNLNYLTAVSLFGNYDILSGSGYGDHLTIGGTYDYNYLSGSNIFWEGVTTGDYNYGSGSTGSTDPIPDPNPDNSGTPSFSELDPLVLNLSGSAVQTQNLVSSTAFFDVQNIGVRDHTGWGTAGEGYLVYDPQNINSVSGESSLVSGFSALKVLDANNDGVLNPLDAAWASMKVWVDANGSGTFAAGSLMTMAQIGIASINVNASHVGQLQSNNTILDDSRFTWNNGTTGDIAGVDFNFHANTVTTYEPPDPPDPPACVQIESILPSGVRAGDVKVGDVLELADEKSLLPSKGVVTYSERARSIGLRLRTEGGISLVCSHTAPIATLGGIVLAPLLLGKKIATRRGQESDGLATWETVIALEYLGEIEVQHITVGDRCFWAGESAHEYVLHHNRKYN